MTPPEAGGQCERVYMSANMHTSHTHHRLAKKTSLSRTTTRVQQRIMGAAKRKLKKYKKLMAGEG